MPQNKKNEFVKTELHAWRLCPIGEHFVREHTRKTFDGTTTIHAHCAQNPSKHDVLYPDEMMEIAARNFNNSNKMLCPNRLNFGNIGSAYDVIIAGWTAYWNDVLPPEIPLTPNHVKALIASESSFNILASNNFPKVRGAHGLMQITGQTIPLLGGVPGGLKEHLIKVSKKDLYDPILNIASGVRWLFEKKRLADAKLQRAASWEEAVANYKSELALSSEKRDGTQNYLSHLFIYEQCSQEENERK